MININNLAPVVLFVYNRPNHTRMTIEALQKNHLAKDSILYIFADGAKTSANDEQIASVQQTREYIKTVSGFKEVVIEEAQQNKGLANSVIYGVTKVINLYGKVIVVEDDIVTHRFFLQYMNDCLSAFTNRDDIYMIGGFNHNFEIPSTYSEHIYLTHRSCSWGWATWKNRWEKADWNVSGYIEISKSRKMQKKFNRGGKDNFPMLKMQMEGKIDSWCIRWDYSMFINNAFCAIPIKSLVENCGFDNSGTHCGFVRRNFTAPFPKEDTYYFKINSNLKFSKEIERKLVLFLDKKPETDTIMWKFRHYVAKIGLYNVCKNIKHIIIRFF